MFMYSVDDDDNALMMDDYRDENEGSIITSLISQLRYCPCLSFSFILRPLHSFPTFSFKPPCYRLSPSKTMWATLLTLTIFSSLWDAPICRVGMDLSKVTFPTFVLEPRSMLERITDFMSHPDLIFG